jgi:hypothetical protein
MKIATIIFILLLTAVAWCQDMQVPVEQQVPLIMKILSFDRNLTKRVDKEIVFAIVYQKKFRKSLDTKLGFEETLDKLSLTKIDSLPIKFISIDIGDDTNLASVLDKSKINVLYLAPVKTIRVEEISEISKRLQITTITGVAEYSEKGMAVAIGAKGDKPEIIINLTAAKAEGINFNSQLLKLAKIVE